MEPLDIWYALKKAGITQASIAAECGVSAMTISKVVRKLLVSDRLMRAVAEKIHKDPYEVFPEYYRQPAKRSTSKVAQEKAA